MDLWMPLNIWAYLKKMINMSKTPSISYAVICCNEYYETITLLDFLIEHKRKKDEIVILFDDKGDKDLWKYLLNIEENISLLHHARFKNDFSECRNKLKKLCSKEYIFMIDADEIPNENLVKKLPYILESNPEFDMFYVPRINIVEGITEYDIKLWNWNINEKGWVQWPDVQGRIIKNQPHLNYVNKVHEKVDGAKLFSILPLEEEYSLYHPKTIERQRLQNSYYEKI